MDLTYLIITSLLGAASLTLFILWQRASHKLKFIENLQTSNEEAIEIEAKKTRAEQNARIEAETAVKLAEQKMQSLVEQMNDWEKTKEQHLEAAKASMLKASAEMSSKLLDDHKREAETQKKETEKRVKETTEELNKKFQNVFESVSTLNDQIKESKKTVEIVKNSLLTPSGAGSLAEITLENIFKASGLIKDQDYIMQYWVDGGEEKSSKPDAIVFLPGDSAMIIDSKASKFFVELGEAVEKAQEKEVSEQLKQTMNNHLKDLIKRDYKKAVEEQFKKSDKIGNIGSVNVLMFLPTDAALEKLRKIDPKFTEKAWKEQILPVGPSTLIQALLQANLLISKARQEQNYQVIINEVKNLLSSIGTLHNLADGLGNNIKSAFKKYDAFAGSFNRNFLSKAKKLSKLGVALPKNQELNQLERHSFIAADLEGESEEIEEVEVKKIADG